MMLYLPLDWNSTVGDPGVLSVSHIASAVRSLCEKVRQADFLDVEALHFNIVNAASGREATLSEQVTSVSGSVP